LPAPRFRDANADHARLIAVRGIFNSTMAGVYPGMFVEIAPFAPFRF
jgi:hypothetical protein